VNQGPGSMIRAMCARRNRSHLLTLHALRRTAVAMRERPGPPAGYAGVNTIIRLRSVDKCKQRIHALSRPCHPNKHVEAAVVYAESKGWRVEMSKGHAWGKLFCPLADPSGCRMSVWSTPRSPENHAKQIRGKVDKCPH
jgi:hypothetical protein